MSGTPIHYAAIVLRARNAVPGTRIRHRVCCAVLRSAMRLRVRYVMLGTDLGYAATLYCPTLCYCTILTYAMLLPGLAHTSPSSASSLPSYAICLCAPYAFSGTNLGYDATLSAYASPV
eukprot:3941356-Rhodomonas_salina.1